MPKARLDPRFGDESATALSWSDVEELLVAAELYWLTTVRLDGRPHVAPLVGVWRDGAFAFCTGEDEQKNVNMRATPLVAVTTGTNRWRAGTDVVVEGAAERVTDRRTLEALAAAWFAKYGDAWKWSVVDDRFQTAGSTSDSGGGGLVYRVPPSKVIAFAKDPHGQTTFRF